MTEGEAETLEEIRNWIRFMGMNEARDVIDDALSYENDEEKERSARIAYELTDGTNSTTDIEEYIDYSYRWVSRRQMEWSKLGIVDKPSETQSYEHLASLTELGLHCPEIQDPDSAESEEADSDETESDDSRDPSAEVAQPTLEDSATE